MAITIVDFPTTIKNCVQSWNEKQAPNVMRTSMENQTVKVRRRTTGIQRTANISITLKREQYQDFMTFFNVTCQQGVLPAYFTTPYGAKEAWRFTEAPQIDWIEPKAFSVTAVIEQLPAWRGL